MTSASPRVLARRLYESIADDERLRGGLTDAGYAPILRWCASRALAVAESVGDADLQDLQDGLCRTVAAVVDAAETGRAEALQGVDARLLGTAAAQRAVVELARAPDEPNARAAAIARALDEG